ncbi:MAG TPA: hypothetical protein VJX67_24940, partial [Blastocatellia bacterium]|nr:hypothetical protein [Blastocatellia bacterium]
GPQSYKFTCDYFTSDTSGKPLGKDRVSGIYTRNLPERKARWSDVSIAHANGFDDPYPPGTPQTYMDGFTYTPGESSDMFRSGFFEGFPPSEMKTKNLVWDTVAFESFAWPYFDKLVLNTPYSLHPNQDVPLGSEGNFNNRNVVLTWVGISTRDGVPCALIDYEALFNSFSVSTGTVKAKGRSHYWGEIWVSLETKQIEYATLLEDVLTEVTIGGQGGEQGGGQPNKMLLNVFRKGAFEKQKN